MKDYYYILGVDHTASIEEIKDAHRKLSKKFHPDLNPNDSHSTNMFREVQAGYEQLADPTKRKQYDADYFNWMNHATPSIPPAAPANKMPVIIPTRDKKTTKLAILWISLIGFIVCVVFMQDDQLHINWFLRGLTGAILLNVFMLPFIIALWKRHPVKWGILIANIIFGWTGVGWVACFIFSVLNQKDRVRRF